MFMPPVTLTFEVHQPYRLRVDGVKETDSLHQRYFDGDMNKHFFKDVEKNCYRPATERLLGLVKKFKGEDKEFKLTFSISGTWIEQAKKWAPDLIDLLNSFPDENVEFLAQTYYHSMSSLFPDKREFKQQVEKSREIIKDTFGRDPQVMTNTELLYNNDIGRVSSELGFKGVFTEGAPRILGWRSPNYLYTQPSFVTEQGNKILLRNRRLTDDVGYRFSREGWDEWPLTADKYAAWLSREEGQVVNLFMDFETFGEHHWKGTGIFDFLEHFPEEVLKRDDLKFALPSEVLDRNEAKGEFDVFEYNTISWADIEMDSSAWLGNPMQMFLFKTLRDIEDKVRSIGDKEILDTWRKLLTSDHLHNICTKTMEDGSVHNYFSYFDHPHQGFAVISSRVMDFVREVERRTS